MAEPILLVEELRKIYGGSRPLEVLKGINMRLEAGEFVALLGQSGSGKSTLLNILGALDRPTSGRVVFEGRCMAQLDPWQLAHMRNCCIGFVFQFHYLLAEFTCLENALMPLAIRDGMVSVADTERVTAMLQRVGLGERLHNRPRQLSGGEQQRTAIIRALANQPRLVLADEPTGNLDSRSGAEVFALMRQMNVEAGAAFLMVTHDERLATKADRIVRLEDGRLV